jgi:hypothetical protein
MTSAAASFRCRGRHRLRVVAGCKQRDRAEQHDETTSHERSFLRMVGFAALWNRRAIQARRSQLCRFPSARLTSESMGVKSGRPVNLTGLPLLRRISILSARFRWAPPRTHVYRNGTLSVSRRAVVSRRVVSRRAVESRRSESRRTLSRRSAESRRARTSGRYMVSGRKTGGKTVVSRRGGAGVATGSGAGRAKLTLSAVSTDSRSAPARPC